MATFEGPAGHHMLASSPERAQRRTEGGSGLGCGDGGGACMSGWGWSGSGTRGESALLPTSIIDTPTPAARVRSSSKRALPSLPCIAELARTTRMSCHQCGTGARKVRCPSLPGYLVFSRMVDRGRTDERPRNRVGGVTRRLVLQQPNQSVPRSAESFTSNPCQTPTVGESSRIYDYITHKPTTCTLSSAQSLPN